MNFTKIMNIIFVLIVSTKAFFIPFKRSVSFHSKKRFADYYEIVKVGCHAEDLGQF